MDSSEPCPGWITLVVAMDENAGMGYQGTLPWHLPADLRHFRHITSGKTVVMGRKTHESIAKALPQRRNIVLSRHPADYSGCEVIHAIEALFQITRPDEQLMIIGGADIFRQFLPMARDMYRTRVHARLPADTFFPDLDAPQWILRHQEKHPADARHSYALSFEYLERK